MAKRKTTRRSAQGRSPAGRKNAVAAVKINVKQKQPEVISPVSMHDHLKETDTKRKSPKKAAGERVSKTPEATMPNYISLVSWNAPEYVYYKKDLRWYLVGGIFAVALVAIFVVMRDWLAAVTIALATALAYLYAEEKPKNVDYAITDVGIKSGEKFYPYGTIKEFWIVYSKSEETLHFDVTNNRFFPYVTIQIKNADPVEIREALRLYIPEKEEGEEDFFHKLTRFFRY